MSDINEHNLNEQEVPFFARYLEGQGVEEFAEDLSEEELKSVRGGYGHPAETRKYPSDNEDGSGGGAVTQKYPSDHEDGSGGGAVTMKAPSDSDEIFTSL